jgi:hypothetical protein
MNWVWWLIGGLGVAGVGLYVVAHAGQKAATVSTQPTQPQQPPQPSKPSAPTSDTGSDTGFITCMAAWPCADGSTQSGCTARAACANHGGPAIAGRIAIVEEKTAYAYTDSNLAWNQTEQTPIWDRI